MHPADHFTPAESEVKDYIYFFPLSVSATLKSLLRKFRIELKLGHS